LLVGFVFVDRVTLRPAARSLFVVDVTKGLIEGHLLSMSVSQKDGFPKPEVDKVGVKVRASGFKPFDILTDECRYLGAQSLCGRNWLLCPCIIRVDIPLLY
jgi:hypothetical protein